MWQPEPFTARMQWFPAAETRMQDVPLHGCCMDVAWSGITGMGMGMVAVRQAFTPSYALAGLLAS